MVIVVVSYEGGALDGDDKGGGFGEEFCGSNINPNVVPNVITCNFVLHAAVT